VKERDEEDAPDFGEEIRINKYQLDDECERQPSLYHRYSRQLADAKKVADKAEDQLKFMLATTESDLRAGAANAGVKITDAGVKAELELSAEVITAREELREANGRVYILQAAVNALEHRRSSLDNEVKLWLAGYFATPSGKDRGVEESTREESVARLNKKRKGED